jgi:hypothetical protein
MQPKFSSNLKNGDPLKNSTVRRIEIDINDEYANARAVIRLNCEPLSKEISKSDSLEEGHFGPSNSRHWEMMIDFKAEKVKPLDSTLFSCENDIENNDEQYRKHSNTKICLCRGTVMQEHRNATDPISFNSELLSNETDDKNFQ